MVDLVKAEPAIKSKKKADYTLNEDKALEKLKTNLQRGDVHVENTPKNGAKLIYMNPGEFKEVMDYLVRINVGQKFTVGTVNVNVVENCEMEEKVHKKIQHKMVLRLNRRTFPTATTNQTLHIYPTIQKFMIQGSNQAQAMGEKEFLIPLIKKVLAGREESVDETNNAVSSIKTNPKIRKAVVYPCDYCKKTFPSIPAQKKHVVMSHVIAIEANNVSPTTNISPSSSPPPAKKLETAEDQLKVKGCMQCGVLLK